MLDLSRPHVRVQPRMISGDGTGNRVDYGPCAATASPSAKVGAQCLGGRDAEALVARGRQRGRGGVKRKRAALSD